MELKNKFIVGTFIGLVVLLGGLFTANVFEDKIEVSLPSDVCEEAILRVTKDDFTLKCGRRIAFQADTLVEYYKTYGPDEWVRNQRFVGANKKNIQLHLEDHGNYFDIVRTTRYRKGRQSVEDGILKEIYTFTKDKIKITYDYKVNNKALHRISMRVKKQYKSYLDAFDPNGYTGVMIGDILSYEGYGDLLIDPTVTLNTPGDKNVAFNEGDTAPFNCSFVDNNVSTLRNVSLYWTAFNGTWMSNGTQTISGNGSVIFSRTIPHLQTNGTGTFKWNCMVCNISQTTDPLADSNCTFASANRTMDPRYFPHAPLLKGTPSIDVNPLSGSDINLSLYYRNYTNHSMPNDIYVNWTYQGMPDNSTNVTYSLSYYGTDNPTRIFSNFNFPENKSANASKFAYFKLSNLSVDNYFFTLHACNGYNETHFCSNVSSTVPLEIFDYTVNTSSLVQTIRFSTLPSITKSTALGQTGSKGIIQVNNLGGGDKSPDGLVNLTLNVTAGKIPCLTYYAGANSTASEAFQIPTANGSRTIYRTVSSNPTYIWLWVTKNNCGTTTISPTFDIEYELK